MPYAVAMRNISSINLFQKNGWGLHVYIYLSSNLDIYMFAFDGAILVPMAVPAILWKCL